MSPRPSARPTQVLVVDASTDAVDAVRRWLEEVNPGGYDVRGCRDGREALATLRESRWDVVLAECRPGAHVGRDLLGLTREQGIEVPILVMSDRDDREADLQALRAGAASFLVKSDLDGTRLDRAIRYARELQQARHALHDSEAHTLAVLDGAVDGMITIDLRGRILTFNPAASRIFGYAPEDIIGENVSCLMPEADSRHHDEYIGRYLRTGEARIIGIGREVMGRRKDGRLFPLDLAISEVRLRGERGFLGVTRDLTDRKNAEEELRQARALAQQRERLADIGAITARIVHDIGNPVAGVLMQARQLLQKVERRPGIGGIDLKPGIERIEGAARHLEALVREFLDFSREQRLDLRRVTLPTLLGEIVRSWQPLAASRNIAVTGDCPEDLPPLLLDEEKIRRVFDNLIKNAVEAIDQGPGSIEVRAQRMGTDRVGITVTDSGPGISAGIEPFQLFETTKQNGTGLGLAIVQQFVIAHGGSVGFSGRQPHGTEFHLEIPLRP